jgi:hypothetical protein
MARPAFRGQRFTAPPQSSQEEWSAEHFMGACCHEGKDKPGSKMELECVEFTPQGGQYRTF